MSTAPPKDSIESKSLSAAWLTAFSQFTSKGSEVSSPLTVSFNEFDTAGFPIEDKETRQRLDQQLERHESVSVEVCASTIFPLFNLQLMESRLSRLVDAVELGEYYRTAVFPRMRTLNAKSNGRGTYFFRMTNFGADPKVTDSIGRNQLAELLAIWKDNPHIAQSALQIAIREPARDLTRNPRPFFPCLQQVSISYDTYGGIAITGYYPTQYIFPRAYGNYLGLAHLGWYIARAMEKKLVRVNCICANPLLGAPEKTNKSQLRKAFEDLINNAN